MKKALIIWFTLNILVLCSSANSRFGDLSFSFATSHNAPKWGKICKQGQAQSPIDIKTKSTQKVKYNPLVLENYNKIYPAILFNDGHTVQIKITGDDMPSVTGGCLKSSYIFDQLHFHWSSEHTVDGKKFPLEMHLVHHDIKFKSLKDAITHDGLAVIAVFFDLSSEDDIKLKPLIELIEKVDDKIYTSEDIKVRLLDYLPTDITKFYSYHGSLTTPDCNEGVIWTIFANPVPISKRQLEHFTNLKGGDHKKIGDNYRSIQKLNKRAVFLHEMGH